jgi:citrate synthase
MSLLRERLAAKIPVLRDEIRDLIKKHGDVQISEVTVSQAYGGMRGVKGMICDTSEVDPESGLIIRGRPIAELTDRLPEEVFWLLLLGELPNHEELESLHGEFTYHRAVPHYVWRVLDALPVDTHPMTQFAAAIMSMQRESQFVARYHKMSKEQYWEATLADAIRLLARLPGIAAGIYRQTFHKGERIPCDTHLDWAANYSYMLGETGSLEECRKMMRLYMVLHCDHEGGNVSANTCHTVGSALSDPYLAVAAGLNGLAGPLHGLANQECLDFVLEIEGRYGGVPSDEELRDMCWERLNSGQVIPGYGHAVLRVPDPRYVALHRFGAHYFPNDVIYQIVDKLFRIVPDVLREQGKAKDPWPNVDAASGSILYHYGMTEFSYYTVLFGVSRSMGMLAQLILNRAIGTPITRPKSVSTAWIKQTLGT